MRQLDYCAYLLHYISSVSGVTAADAAADAGAVLVRLRTLIVIHQ